MRRFGEAGVNTITFFPANTANSLGEPYCKYPPNWLWFDKYDFSVVDRQIADILIANPNAELICMADLNSPLWLTRQLAGNNADSFTNLSEAISNPRWLEATGNYLEALARHCESKHGGRICSYVLACGYTDEWMDYSNGNATADKFRRYHEWCVEHQFDPPADIPPQSLRDHIGFDDFLRDPESDGEALRYWKFTSDLIVDGISHFAGILRPLIRPGVEIGVFYGYIMELTRLRLVRSGHLAYERLLASPLIDYFISPGTYSDRGMGAGGGFMIPDVTMRRHGKGYMHECDQRTHCFNPNLSDAVKLDFFHWADENEDIAGMRREMALSLIKHTSLWWFDMWGGYYQSDAVYDNIRQMREIWSRFSDDDSESIAQTALIVDPESVMYVNDLRKEVGQLNHDVRNRLNRLGAPFDVLSLRDIPEISDFNRYKFVIFNSAFELTPEKMEILERFVLNRQRLVLWLYAAGISDGKRIVPETTARLCGCPFKTPGLNVTGMNGWTSAYLYDYQELSSATLKKLATDAGVNIFCEAEQPVFANQRLLAVHTATGGRQKIHLGRRYRKVVELYSGRTAAIDADEFEYDFKTPDTGLFELTD